MCRASRPVRRRVTARAVGIRLSFAPVSSPTKTVKRRISIAMRVLAEIIASDVSLLVTFNHAIDGVIQDNPKARANPKALAQLHGYKRQLVVLFQ
jgi:hypothetical protein